MDRVIVIGIPDKRTCKAKMNVIMRAMTNSVNIFRCEERLICDREE